MLVSSLRASPTRMFVLPESWRMKNSVMDAEESGGEATHVEQAEAKEEGEVELTVVKREGATLSLCRLRVTDPPVWWVQSELGALHRLRMRDAL